MVKCNPSYQVNLLRKAAVLHFWLIMTVLMGTYVQSNAQLIPFRQDYKWGFKNLRSGSVLEPKYDYVSDFDAFGNAVVTSEGKDAIMDTSGVLRTSLFPGVLIPFNESFYLEESLKDNRRRLVSYADGETMQDSIKSYKSYRANRWIGTNYTQVEMPGGKGLMKQNGEMFIPAAYSSITFQSDRFFARKNAVTHTYDREGVLIDSGRYSSYRVLSDGTYRTTGFSGKKIGVLDAKKKVIVPPKWDYVNQTDYPNFYVVSNREGKTHLFNVTRQECIDPFPFVSFVSYKNGYIKLYNGKKYGLINSEGEIILKDTFEIIKPWTKETVVAKASNRYGVFTSQGKSVSGLIYKLIEPISSHKVGLFINKHGKKGLYNSKGKKIIPCKYDQIERSGNVFRTKVGDITMHYTLDREGNITSSKQIKNLHVLSIKKFKLRDNFEELGSEPSVEDLRSFDPKRLVNDSLRIYLELQGSARTGYRLYDLKKKKGLTDYILKYFDLRQLVRGNVALVGILSNRRKNILVTRKGNFRNTYKYKGKTYRVSDLDQFQDDYFKFVSNTTKGLSGIINRNGKMILPPFYEKVQSVQDDRIIAKLPRKGWGMISTNGEVLIPFTFIELDYDNNQNPQFVKTYSDCGKAGFVDSIGHEITDLKYVDVRPFSNDFAAVKYNNRWTFVNQNGKEMSEPKYERVQDYSDGYAAVRISNRWGFLDSTGKEVIKPQYRNALSFGSGLAPAKIEQLYGFVNKNNQMVIPMKFKRAFSFKNGLAIVKKNKKYGIIDTTGNWVVMPRYRAIKPIGEGFDLKKGRIRHYIGNNNGEVYKKEYFKMVWDLGEGLYGVKKRRNRKVIDGAGRSKVAPRLLETKKFHSGFAWMKTKQGWGVIDTSGSFVVPDTFAYIIDFNLEGISLGSKKRNKVKIWVVDGKLRLETTEDWWNAGNKYLGQIGQNKRYITGNYSQRKGIVDEHNHVILAKNYSYISPFINGFSAVIMERSVGIYQLDGTKTCDPVYEEVVKVKGKKLFRVRRGGKIGYLDENGVWVMPIQN